MLAQDFGDCRDNLRNSRSVFLIVHDNRMLAERAFYCLEEMCMGNRKEEILIVALHLFARDGYEAVSVSQIAGELDMTKGALYRHYKSKRDIFDCIVQCMYSGVCNDGMRRHTG